MTQNSNQFIQSEEKGRLTLLENINVFNCKIDTDEGETLLPGTAVKLKDVSGPVIIVEEIDADTDDIFGFVPYNVKGNEHVANDMIKVASLSCVMVMEASAAIARGADLEFAVATIKVKTAVGTNRVIGKSLDKAAADGDLVRVLITIPVVNQETSAILGTLTVGGLSTLATINASGLAAFAANITVGTTLGVTGVSTLTGGIVNGGNLKESVLNYSAGAGVIPITKDIVFLTTGGAEALSIVDGVAGQRLKIIMVSDGGDGTLTPDNFGNGATITFDNNDSVELIFDGTNWWTVGTPTAAIG